MIYHTFQNHKSHLPGEGLPEKEAMYTVELARPGDVDWIAKLEAEFYSTTDAVPRSFLEEWYNANPNCFFIIRNPSGKKVGHIDILPLRPKTLEAFKDGTISEKGIRGDSLYYPTERSLIKDLYVESIIIDSKQCSSPMALRALLSNFPSMVEKICEPLTVQNIYAIAASREGSKLLKELGFDVIRSKRDRVDNHDFFASTLRDFASEIYRRISSTRIDDKNVSLLENLRQH